MWQLSIYFPDFFQNYATMIFKYPKDNVSPKYDTNLLTDMTMTYGPQTTKSQ